MQLQVKPIQDFTAQQHEAAADQQVKLKELLDLYDEGTQIFRLSGIAGCGKTHLTVEFIRALLDRFRASEGRAPTMAGAALSHGAKNVLADRFMNEKITIKFYTLASVLKLSRWISDTGEIKFIPKYRKLKHPKLLDRPPIYFLDIIIIDECSQVSQEMLDLLIEEKGLSTVILFLGDHHQTPPPSEKRKADEDSPSFNFPGVNLTIPFRYEGYIQKVATAVANEIDCVDRARTFRFLIEFAKQSGKDVTFTRNGPQFFEDFSNSFINDDDKIFGSILVSYRNRVTSELSRTIRRKILTKLGITEPARYLPGERLVCRRGVKEIDGTAPTELTTHKVVSILRVKSHYASIKTPKKDKNKYESIKIGDTFAESFDPESSYTHIPIFLLDLIDEKGVEYNDVPILKDDLNMTYLTWKNRIKDEAESEMQSKYWAKYYDFMEFFSEFEFGYAVNTYVVQGASYDNVFVNLRDIMSVGPLTVREKLQSLYTALTRARKTVTILF